MTLQVVFYCPDTHIEYNGRTPYETGVGGGVTIRVRMARALARRGHRVRSVVNCRKRQLIDGVEYVPLADLPSLDGDVLVVNTSGGRYDLTPLNASRSSARLAVLWASGVDQPHAFAAGRFDFVYATSNFLRNVICERWGVPSDRVFVSYNGYDEELFVEAEKSARQRDPFRLVYFSHPSKGLEAAVSVVHRLRAKDNRFHLVTFGGEALWGRESRQRESIAGVVDRGLIGQQALSKELQTCTYCIALQAREEPFGMVVTEAMRAGCIVLASPVGAYSELIGDGVNGCLVPGDHSSVAVHIQTANRIFELSSLPEHAERLRRQAIQVPWSADLMARVWEGHWERVLEGEGRPGAGCDACGAATLALADGSHCQACGRYWPGGLFEAHVPLETSVDALGSLEGGN